MKCTKKETRFEHEEAILVLKDEEGKKRLDIFKRGDAERSQWHGTLPEVAHLMEAFCLLSEELHLPLSTLQQATALFPSDAFRSTQPTLNGAEPPEGAMLGHVREGEDRFVVQLSKEQLRELLDRSNALLKLSAAETSHQLQNAKDLARLVNAVFGGTSAVSDEVPFP